MSLLIVITIDDSNHNKYLSMIMHFMNYVIVQVICEDC